MRLGRIGFDNVAGYLDDGMRALKDREELVAYTPADVWNSGDAMDRRTRRAVRARRAHARRMAAAPHRRQHEHPAEPAAPNASTTIPRNRPVIAMCAGGYRSSIAASLLQRAGFTRVSELTGGMAAVPA